MGKYKVDFGFGLLFLSAIAISWWAVYFFSLSYRVNILIAMLSVVVFGTVFSLRYFGKGAIVGFFFLGTVVFKMFGVGYLALFEPDFKENLIIYFCIFWFYLCIEALYIVACVKEQDKYHVK